MNYLCGDITTHRPLCQLPLLHWLCSICFCHTASSSRLFHTTGLCTCFTAPGMLLSFSFSSLYWSPTHPFLKNTVRKSYQSCCSVMCAWSRQAGRQAGKAPWNPHFRLGHCDWGRSKGAVGSRCWPALVQVCASASNPPWLSHPPYLFLLRSKAALFLGTSSVASVLARIVCTKFFRIA